MKFLSIALIALMMTAQVQAQMIPIGNLNYGPLISVKEFKKDKEAQKALGGLEASFGATCGKAKMGMTTILPFYIAQSVKVKCVLQEDPSQGIKIKFKYAIYLADRKLRNIKIKFFK